jgi:hypothetical protein
MRNVSDQSFRENQNEHLCSITFAPENRAVDDIKWKRMAEPNRPQTTM